MEWERGREGERERDLSALGRVLCKYLQIGLKKQINRIGLLSKAGGGGAGAVERSTGGRGWRGGWAATAAACGTIGFISLLLRATEH